MHMVNTTNWARPWENLVFRSKKRKPDASDSNERAIKTGCPGHLPATLRCFRHTTGRLLFWDSPCFARAAYSCAPEHGGPDVFVARTCNLPPPLLPGESLPGRAAEFWRTEWLLRFLWYSCR